jgi:hypothetical protein
MVLRKNEKGYQVFKEEGKLKSVHKRVCEKKMGGKVRKGYEVHHKDGNKNNNRPGNLIAIKKSTHRRIHAKRKSSG